MFEENIRKLKELKKNSEMVIEAIEIGNFDALIVQLWEINKATHVETTFTGLKVIQLMKNILNQSFKIYKRNEGIKSYK